MSKKQGKKPQKNVAGKADRGQANDQRAIANLAGRLKTLEDRTISTRGVAKLENRQAERYHKLTPLPGRPATSPYLTESESSYHDWLKGRDDSLHHALPNFNVEPTIAKQKWRGRYKTMLTVGSNTTTTVLVNSAVTSSADYGGGAGETQKAFLSKVITNSGGVGVAAVPGPADSGGLTAGALLVGNQTGADAITLEGGSCTTPVGYYNVIASDPVCPFTGTSSDGNILRWQLVRIRVMTDNLTKGSDRGGQATIIQTRNNCNDIGATAQAAAFLNRGIYRVFDDMNITEPTTGTTPRWVSMDVRPGLQAFHCANTSSANARAGAAAAIIAFFNATTVSQSVMLYVELDWELAGTAVRGVATNHVVCPLAADHAREVSQAMRAAGVMPSQQGPAHSVAAGLKLANDRALQVATHGPNAPRESIAASVKKIVGHPLVQKLAASGFAAFKHYIGM